jgi:MinD superfamily P-loop ATPase
MKQILVISGKGGTGKTVITAAFATLAGHKVIADCDVDAADLHLLLHPVIKETHTFKGLKKARIDQEKCTACGECVELCRYNAITPDFHIDPVSCEGCSVCMHVCPVEAICMEDNIAGEWFVSHTEYGPMVHARLGIAEENSGKLVTVVRQNAKSIAEKINADYIIIDGPPGIGCPVIASLAGMDIALVVTEPTIAGIHDMERVIQVTKHFGINAACAINKFDINLDNTKNIENWCRNNGVPVFGKIKYHISVIESIAQGKPLPEYTNNQVTQDVKNIWQKLNQYIHNNQ